MNDTATVKKKLKGICPIFWINLDTEVDRKEYMEDLLGQFDIPNTRISGVDARGDNDVSDLLSGRFPDMVNQGELGCTLSHLKAIKHFYYETDLEYAIIAEDDLSLDTVEYWPFTWKGFMSKVPYDWDILHLAITSTKNLRVNLHPRLINDFCTVLYVINRKYAEKLLKLHCRGDKYKVDQKIKPRAVADELIYNAGVTYSMPLFTYRYDFESGIHQDHVELFHKQNVEGIMGFWRQYQCRDPYELIDYEYYSFYQPLIGE